MDSTFNSIFHRSCFHRRIYSCTIINLNNTTHSCTITRSSSHSISPAVPLLTSS